MKKHVPLSTLPTGAAFQSHLPGRETPLYGILLQKTISSAYVEQWRLSSKETVYQDGEAYIRFFYDKDKVTISLASPVIRLRSIPKPPKKQKV